MLLLTGLLAQAGMIAIGAPQAPGTPQAPGAGAPTQPARTGQPGKWYMLGRVTSVTGVAVFGANVTVYVDTKAAPIRQFETSFQGEFEISLDLDSTKGRRLKVVAKKDGYFDAVETVALTFENKPDAIELVLRTKEEDPDQLPLGTLISSVAQRFQTPGGAATSQERNDTVQRAQGLLEDDDPDGALQLLSKGIEREPNCVEFRTLWGLAMVQAGSWSSGVRQITEADALNVSTDAKSRRSEPKLILGVFECWRGNPERATEIFLQALQVEPANPLLLQELGRACLLQQKWPDAEAYFAKAIQAGAFPEARLLRAQALLAEAKPSGAEGELQTYLGGRKPRTLPMARRLWWEKLHEREELQAEAEGGARKSAATRSLPELSRDLPELQGIEPAKGQEELASILQKVGDHVEAFFRNFQNTSSHEEIRQELLRGDGKVKSSLTQNFQYMLLAWPDKTRPTLQEYRTEPKGKPYLAPDQGSQNLMTTEGFASASHVFLPAYQSESTFVYLGRQPMDDHQTFVVAFAQRPEAARLLTRFRTNQGGALALNQGVAWIDREAFQIVRLRTDLLSPVERIGLDRETTEIHYSEVHFKDVPLAVWLPRDVAVTVEWQGKLRRNRHTYSDFHLFTVESKIGAAIEAPPQP